MPAVSRDFATGVMLGLFTLGPLGPLFMLAMVFAAGLIDALSWLESDLFKLLASRVTVVITGPPELDAEPLAIFVI